MFKSFYLSKDWRIWSWGGLLTLIISLFFQVRMTVAINTWYGKFYDLLQNAGDFKNNPSDGKISYKNGNPQITFFKAIYRRHTNFSMESKFLILLTSTISAPIPKIIFSLL